MACEKLIIKKPLNFVVRIFLHYLSVIYHVSLFCKDLDLIPNFICK